MVPQRFLEPWGSLRNDLPKGDGTSRSEACIVLTKNLDQTVPSPGSSQHAGQCDMS